MEGARQAYMVETGEQGMESTLPEFELIVQFLGVKEKHLEGIGFVLSSLILDKCLKRSCQMIIYVLFPRFLFDDFYFKCMPY